MPVNEASLRVYFMGSFHRKFVDQNCVFDIFKNIENDYSLDIEEKSMSTTHHLQFRKYVYCRFI